MIDYNDLYQTADWKKEKHTPIIEIIGEAKKAEPITIKAMVGKEITHPNTTEHHIRWIDIYFKPQGEKFPFQIGRCEFTAHGASTDGANTSTVHSEPELTVVIKTNKPGIIFAESYCNIHGLWRNEMELKL
ncbi:MAG: superoxide reductase [Candidatus Lokiarchaeota archaeon]|nr:superoxide reductase [Candidatus Lokiarchaeota archaeon]